MDKEISDADYNQSGQEANPLVTLAVPGKPTQPYAQTGVNGWGLSKSFKGGRILEDDNGRAIIYPVVITNLNLDIPTNTTTPNTDNQTPNSALSVSGFGYYYNNTTGVWERARTGPTLVTSGGGTVAGTVAIIAAGGAGVKYRIWRVVFQALASAGEVGTFTLGDIGATYNNIVNLSEHVATTTPTSVTLDFGPNGLLQPTANAAIETVVTGALTVFFVMTVMYSVG